MGLNWNRLAEIGSKWRYGVPLASLSNGKKTMGNIEKNEISDMTIDEFSAFMNELADEVEEVSLAA